MTDLDLIEIGEEGTCYIRNCLAQGTGLLEKLAKLSLETGKSSALVPSGTHLPRAVSFDAGGLMRARDANIWLAEHLQKLQAESRRGTCVFQDVWAIPEDRASSAERQRRFLSERNVYFYIRHNDISITTVEQTRRSLKSFLIVGIFTDYEFKQRGIAADYLVKPEEIAAIVEATREILVSAYDQEGWVIWHR